MQKQSTITLSANQFTDAAFAASRQVWLAGLGAASLARDWTRNEARSTFHNLVRQGSTVETRAMRVIGNRVETSVATATSLLRETRRAAVSTIGAVVETAALLLPALKSPASTPRAATKRARNVRKSAKVRGARAVRNVKRVAKKAR